VLCLVAPGEHVFSRFIHSWFPFSNDNM